LLASPNAAVSRRSATVALLASILSTAAYLW
jgi:hypothetical protein